MAQYVQNYTFTNGTTADGGQVDSEVKALGSSVNNIVNAQIASAAAIDVSKTTLGTYTAWTAHVPTFGGFSVNPTYLSSRYCQIGKTVIYVYVANADGVSNATTFTMTLPVAPVVSTRLDFNGLYVNNDAGGSGGTYVGNATVTSGSTMNLFRVTGTWPIVATGQAFTNTGNKGIAGGFTLVYEVA